jgi:hypothetical protein
LEENKLMFKILLMEIEGARFREQEIAAERDCSIERLRGAELLVGSLQAQLCAENEKLASLQGQEDVHAALMERRSIFRDGIVDMLREKEEEL